MAVKKKINVLSLCDGMSVGYLALKKVDNVEVGTYYTSEIDKYATQASALLLPNDSTITRLGDMSKWQDWGIDWSSIDLLLAGFPCQAWSVAGKQKGDNDPRGALVHTLCEIKAHIESVNPKLKFLFENVRMKKEFMSFISDLFGVEPILINSALVSAQNRQRYYWCNWKTQQPEDKGIMLKDIVHENFGEILNGVVVPTFNINPSGRGMNGDVYSVYNAKSRTLTTNKGEGSKISVNLNSFKVPFDKTLKILAKEVERGKIEILETNSNGDKVYFIHRKEVTMFQIPRGNNPGGFNQRDKSPTLTSNSFEHNNYVLGCITPDRINKRQNGQRFNKGNKFYTLTAQDKHGILIEGYIRKLTPIECFRLQTINEEDINKLLSQAGGKNKQLISNTQLYKIAGNGWTEDVIVGLLQSANLEEKA